MITMGIDIGSSSSKAAVLENGKNILAKSVMPIGIGTTGPETVFKNVLDETGLHRKDLDCLIVTGYGRFSFPEADAQTSELSCHGKGMHFLIPDVRTVIDIGGQDAKVIRINNSGGLINFVMNDKCAAGTGRFLDVMARVLNIKIEELGDLATRSTNELSISNVCTVFAESEVISHLAAGKRIEDIIAGIHRSVSKRVASLGNRVGIDNKVAMSGGVALNKGIVTAMEKELKCIVHTSELSQLAGAIGAAIYGYEKFHTQ